MENNEIDNADDDDNALDADADAADAIAPCPETTHHVRTHICMRSLPHPSDDCVRDDTCSLAPAIKWRVC